MRRSRIHALPASRGAEDVGEAGLSFAAAARVLVTERGYFFSEEVQVAGRFWLLTFMIFS